MVDASSIDGPLCEVLQALGYVEVWLLGSGRWQPLSEASLSGTTQDTRILRHAPYDELAVLVNRATEETIGYARTARAAQADAPDESPSPSTVDLPFLELKTGHPNVRVTAYLLVKLYQRTDVGGSFSAATIATSANLAALRAWDRGVPLTNLDRVCLGLDAEAVPPAFCLAAGASSVRTVIADRPFTLREPYGGKWDIRKTQLTA